MARRKRERVRSAQRTLTNSPAPVSPSSPGAAVPPVPDLRRGPSFRALALSGLLVFLVGGGLALLISVWAGDLNWTRSSATQGPSLGPSRTRGGDFKSLWARGAVPRPTVKPPPFEVKTPEDELIAQFVKLHNKNDPAAEKLLAGNGVDPAQPVTEAEAEVLDAETFLKSDLSILAVWRGEPAGVAQKEVPGRYTLVTKGGATGLELRMKEGNAVGKPSRRVMVSPDVVVEVKGGKIHPLRAQLHEGPDA